MIIGRGLIAPLIGSVVAYGAVTAFMYVDRGPINRGVEMYEWLFAATIFTYYRAEVWLLSLFLMVHLALAYGPFRKMVPPHVKEDPKN